MKIVVDTNVLVSALTSASGSNREVLRVCLKGQVLPLIGPALFGEYEALTRRPAVLRRCPLSRVDREKLIDAFLARCEWTSIHFMWRPNLPDESDNHLIELAVAGGASAIVTNNTRHLKGGELLFPSLRISKPAAFLRQLP